jgi:flagellar basal-body rod protein FlgF/flagellar basal-body rod protein FlgG
MKGSSGMPYGLYISAEGAVAQNRRMEVLANNIANVDTAGFKRQLAIFQARYSEAIEQGSDYSGSRTINDLGGGVLVRETKTDFSPGAIRRTGLETDVAIDGDGFFQVQKGNQIYLTRAGAFEITAEGQLVTPDGYPVLSNDGEPIAIGPDAGPWRINDAGGIEQDGAVTNLGIVRPPSLDQLEHVGENLFALPPRVEAEPVPDEERQVRSGYVEQSSVRATREMMDLIECSRAFEANTTMIKNQDQMLGNLVSRALRVQA